MIRRIQRKYFELIHPNLRNVYIEKLHTRFNECVISFCAEFTRLSFARVQDRRAYISRCLYVAKFSRLQFQLHMNTDKDTKESFAGQLPFP